MGDLFSKPAADTNKYKQQSSFKPSHINNDKESISKQKKMSDFEEQILKLHNISRQTNGLEPLFWDKDLQQKAEDWGKYLSCKVIRHPGTGPDSNKDEINLYVPSGIGQNLFQGSKRNNPEKDAVNLWYNEYKLYNVNNESNGIPSNFNKVGHMTQLLWKDAKKLGCSFYECPDNQIIVCDYDKGNIQGKFRNQVPEKILPLSLK